ncbi:MAG: hypothetical protein Q7V58_09610 [Actinomycetota bacterium]|nr:hypothetical protein [Actinomycetota bacterium]
MTDVMNRPASRWVTYPGDVTHMVGQPVGPTTVGDYLTAVEATHDPDSGTTRVGFAYGLPAPDEDGRWVWHQQARAWIRVPVEAGS